MSTAATRGVSSACASKQWMGEITSCLVCMLPVLRGSEAPSLSDDCAQRSRRPRAPTLRLTWWSAVISTALPTLPLTSLSAKYPAPRRRIRDGPPPDATRAPPGGRLSQPPPKPASLHAGRHHPHVVSAPRPHLPYSFTRPPPWCRWHARRVAGRPPPGVRLHLPPRLHPPWQTPLGLPDRATAGRRSMQRHAWQLATGGGAGCIRGRQPSAEPRIQPSLIPC